MIKRRLSVMLASLSAALALVGATSTASAHELQAEGTPSDLDSGQAGYYVWNDGHEIHVRMTDGATSARLSGTLHTNGKFADLARDGDRHDEHVAISDHGHLLRFRATPGTDLDGFKVRVEDSTRADLRLHRDGDDVPTDQIRLGSDDEHPDGSSFTLHV